MPTAKKNVVQFKGRRFKTPEAHADWVKHDRIANRLRDIANQIGVICWACSGLRETIGEGDEIHKVSWIWRTGCSANLTHRRGGAVMKLIKKRRINLQRKRHPDKLRHRKLARRVRRSRRGRP
jgi:hypothetical protein